MAVYKRRTATRAGILLTDIRSGAQTVTDLREAASSTKKRRAITRR